MDISTGLIDYPFLKRNAELFKPKMIVAGISCCSRKLDYAMYSAVVHCTAVLHCTSLHCILFTRFQEISGCWGGGLGLPGTRSWKHYIRNHSYSS